MKNILNIVRKELDKIFKSPRLIVSTFILPGLLIFIMYSFMGGNMKNEEDKVKNHDYSIVVVNQSTKLEAALKQENGLKMKIVPYQNISMADYQAALEDETSELYKKVMRSIDSGENDLWIFLNPNFDQALTDKGATPVVIVSNTTNQFSATAQSYVQEKLMVLESSVNPPVAPIISTLSKNLASDSQITGMALAMLIPMLIMTFIFAGAMSTGADSIAGEKERGTISTMLMAPISKNEIVIGKIISAIIITLISAICSFIGLMASFMTSSNLFGAVNGSISYGVTAYLEILVMLIMASFIAVSLFLAASTYAKSTKEATMYAMPVYIIAIVSGVLTMFSTKIPDSFGSYLIPLYNLTLGLKGIFLNQLVGWQFLTIIGSNIVYFIFILILVKRLFGNERVMFSK